MVKNLPANAGDVGDVGSILGSGRSPGGQHGNPLQSSCLRSLAGYSPWGHRLRHDWSDLSHKETLKYPFEINIKISPIWCALLTSGRALTILKQINNDNKLKAVMKSGIQFWLNYFYSGSWGAGPLGGCLNSPNFSSLHIFSSSAVDLATLGSAGPSWSQPCGFHWPIGWQQRWCRQRFEKHSKSILALRCPLPLLTLTTALGWASTLAPQGPKARHSSGLSWANTIQPK